MPAVPRRPTLRCSPNATAGRFGSTPSTAPGVGPGRRSGCPHLRLHDLRHTGNTLAAATGASTRELMVRMGHASPQAALIYQHASAERDRAIAAALSKLAEAE